MLISMPTGTSTILGVFQVIPSSQEFGANSTPKLNLGPRPTPRKCGRSSVEQPRAGLTADISLLDEAISLLDKVHRLSVKRCAGLPHAGDYHFDRVVLPSGLAALLGAAIAPN